ncbi:hypothetical protein GCM10010149_88520 [Nonomuraea roseoviolacea subsp. roseoviolacea]|uniref:hypothetical protein n=1 Tax=Nonomuraea roseoviolacea TaxID=103837 RepID=UPI0031E01005
MQRKDIRTDMLYAVDRRAGEPNCVRVIDNSTRVRFSGYASGHPIFSKAQLNNGNSGYAIVVVNTQVEGARERALELTLRDFFEATTSEIGPGLRLTFTKSFLKYVGQYDAVMAERKVEAERAAKELADKEQHAAAGWKLHSFLRDELAELGVKSYTTTASPTFGVVAVASVDFELNELRKLVAMAKAGKRLYDAVKPDSDGVPHLPHGRGDELAYETWNDLNLVFHPPF